MGKQAFTASIEIAGRSDRQAMMRWISGWVGRQLIQTQLRFS
jgi:hypothetical protein